MRRFVTAAALGAILVTSHAFVPDIASADGGSDSGRESRGLLGGLVDTVGDVVSDTLNTTGLDETVQVDLSADDDSLLNASVGVGSSEDRVVDVDVDLALGGDSLAGADVNVVAGDDGSLLAADLQADVAGEEQLGALAADISVADGQVAAASVEADILPDEGLLDVAVDASAGDGALLELEGEASLLGDSLLDAAVNTSVTEGAVLDLETGVEVGGETLLAVDLNGSVAGQDTSAEVDLGGNPADGGAEGVVNTPPSSLPASDPTWDASEAAPDGGRFAIPGAQQAPIPTFTGTTEPSPDRARTRATQPATTIVVVDVAETTFTTELTPLVDSSRSEPAGSRGRFLSEARHSAADVFSGLATNAAASLTLSTSSTAGGIAAALVTSLALGAVWLFLLGHQHLFRAPPSRVCLPAVPPG